VYAVNERLRQTSVVAYVGLGSNLAGPEAQVRQAIDDLGGLRETALSARSPLYRTAPVGPVDQPDFVNAVVRLETRLAPRALLRSLQALELAHGRHRDGTRWGPRTLDLDILLYGDEQVREPGLRIPHPEMAAGPSYWCRWPTWPRAGSPYRRADPFRISWRLAGETGSLASQGVSRRGAGTARANPRDQPRDDADVCELIPVGLRPMWRRHLSPMGRALGNDSRHLSSAVRAGGPRLIVSGSWSVI
jgi:2-amino-4-hydroxy-6-hydroxymethyldihydropteridine diphosphokinase